MLNLAYSYGHHGQMLYDLYLALAGVHSEIRKALVKQLRSCSHGQFTNLGRSENVTQHREGRRDMGGGNIVSFSTNQVSQSTYYGKQRVNDMWQLSQGPNFL